MHQGCVSRIGGFPRAHLPEGGGEAYDGVRNGMRRWGRMGCGIRWGAEWDEAVGLDGVRM